MIQIKPIVLAVLSSTLLCLAVPVAAQDVQERLPGVPLTAGMHIIQAEVAQSPAQRSIGLMNRRTMGANEGMLFVFEVPGEQCFWMKNTLLPLSIAFLSDDGTVVNIEDMQPQTTDSHCSRKEVRYALEMNQGWFARRGVKPGAKLGGTPFGR
jgi:uncharacterized protein